MKPIAPIIGMSPWNSYFKDKEVAFLLRETIKQYGEAVIMVADVPATHTYLAMGYTLAKAQRKARLKGNNLKNRTRKIIEYCWINPSLITIIDREEDVESNPIYQRYRIQIQELYSSHRQFHCSIDTTSEWVLQNSWKKYWKNEIALATRYILSEIAFLEASPELLWAKQSIYIYHKPWRIYEDYIAWIFDWTPKLYLDYKLLEAPFEMHTDRNDWNITRRDRIQQSWVIRCWYFSYLPQLFRKDWVWYHGVFYDTLITFCKQYWLEPVFTEQTWYGIIPQRLQHGLIDIFVSPIWPSLQRKTQAFFTDSFVESELYAYCHKDSQYASKELEDINHDPYLRIACREWDISQDLATKFFPFARIVRVPQLDRIGREIEYVLDNRADIAFHASNQIELILEERWLPLWELIAKWFAWSSIQTVWNCMALPWGEFAMKDALDDVIRKNTIIS